MDCIVVRVDAKISSKGVAVTYECMKRRCLAELMALGSTSEAQAERPYRTSEWL